jgi:two-component system sensor histidine kinase PilS (NtrC family)
MENSPQGLQHNGITKRSLYWFLFARTTVVTLFLGGTIFFQLRSGRGEIFPAPYLLSLLIAISCFQAILSAVLLPKLRRLYFFVQVQIVCDLLFVTTLVYFTGGFFSTFSFLFILVIISSSIFLSRKEVVFVASAATILYGSLLDLQFYRFIPDIGGLLQDDAKEGGRFFYPVFINVTAFFLTAFLSGTVAERLRKSEKALQEREIDFEELNQLNRIILTNITSGLMILDASGMIRSFNAAASRITGYSFDEVYARHIHEFFPGFEIFTGEQFVIVHRGEGMLKNRNGQQMVLGYATSMIEDVQDKGQGLLVTFQDLTRFKELEEQLKRADRLAAVGGLASGMAHEIRNPLASISGSIQLLMESARIGEEDRKLMGIVVKEANRLNNLLTDFLLFARPNPPNMRVVNISLLLDELVNLVVADPRFSSIEIRREYPKEVILSIDREQFRQALWNLFINGAEAMPDGGILYVGITGDEIYIEDTGPGVPEEIRTRIFDPFFTTKDFGSGLGLATVYTIINAHCGLVAVGGGRQGGARFAIRLPEKSSAEQDGIASQSQWRV